VLWSSGRVGAHAQLLEVTPANGSVVSTAPSEVVLRFSEPVSLTGGSVRVLDDAAAPVSAAPVLENAVITVPLDGPLSDGAYTVVYELVSADSHRVSGATVFSVGAPSAGGAVAVEVPGDSAAWPIRAGSAALTTLAYAAALAAAGLGALTVYGDGSRPLGRRRAGADLLDRRWDRAITRAAVLGAVALVTAAPFRIARIGGGLDALRDNAVIETALRGPIGQATVVGAVALLALAVAVDQRAAGWVLLVASAVALAAFALEGHTRAEQRAVMIASDVIHLAAGAVWLGGVAGLFVAFGSRPEPGRLALLVRRFSRAALGAVLVVGAAGAVMAWIILPSLDELTGTGWGLALVTKIAVVLVVIAVGAYNNRRVVPRFDGVAGGRSARRLARTVAAEAVLLLAVVGIAAVLVTRSPISTAAPPPPSPTEVAVELSDGGTLELAVTPAAVGSNRIEAVLRDAEGRIVDPVDPPELSLTQDELGIGPLDPELSPVSLGEYEATAELGYAGDWEVAVRVRVGDFESLAGTAVLTVTE